MDSFDIRYILALTRREILLDELQTMEDFLLAMTSRLLNLQASMRMLEKDLQILSSDSCSSLLGEARESLFLGKANIARLREKYSTPQT